MYMNHKMLRGSSKVAQASKEEVELTKRYMGINDQIKKHKNFSGSVIKGRRHTVDQMVKHFQD